MRVFVAYVSRSWSNEEVATSVRALVAEIWRETEGKFNVVVIKSSNDHDASGIRETIEDMGVSLMLYHLKIFFEDERVQQG